MTAPTRRRAIQLGLAGAALPLGGRAGAAAVLDPSLDATARTRGLRFGSAIGAEGSGEPSTGGVIDNPRYAAVVAGECGLVVPNSEMKWQTLQPRPGAYLWERGDRLTRWAEARGLQVRGHNLIWVQERWLPAWVNAYDFGSRPATAAEKLIVAHVTAVCRHYGDKIRTWDVVNEAIDPDTGGLWPTVLSRALGDRMLDIAFHAAREALPDCQLVYNDAMGWTAGNERHRAGVLTLLEGMRARGAPVDALGLQSHLGQGGSKPVGAPQPREWLAFLQTAAGLDLQLPITELDVGDMSFPSDIAVRDAAVAAYARDYLDLTLSLPQVREVLCWGMVDSFSWLQHFKSRADGLPKRPLPYDAAFRRKPLRAAIAAALRGASDRRT